MRCGLRCLGVVTTHAVLIEKGAIRFGVTRLSRGRRGCDSLRRGSLCQHQRGAGPKSAGAENPFPHFVSAVFFSVSGSGGGTGAGSLGPRCIISRTVAITSSRE